MYPFSEQTKFVQVIIDHKNGNVTTYGQSKAIDDGSLD